MDRAKPSPQIVLDARFLSKPVGGVARVGKELLRALAQEIESLGLGRALRVAVPPGVDLAGMGLASLGEPTRGFSSQLGVQLGLPLLYPSAKVLSPCNVTPLLAASAVVWIHDAHVFDEPDSYSLAYRLWHRGLLAGTRLRRFDVVTVSRYARDRLIHRGVDPARLRVIYNGGDHILHQPEDRQYLNELRLDRGQFVLVVGSPAKHKNLPFAVRALLSGLDKRFRIAVVGLAQVGSYASSGEIPRDSRVLILPRLSDGQLRGLYAAAAAVVCPSLCEGFGLYAAEAMFADSGPLVLSNRASLPEVGGEAALYFDPTDAAALCAAVNDVLRPDVARRLGEAAQRQREQFRWRHAARTVVRELMCVGPASSRDLELAR